MSAILWRPTPGQVEQTLLHRFTRDVLGRDAGYHELWQWSVDEPEAFWGAVWRDGGVRASRGYDRVMGEVRMPGTAWFPGARLNFAENLLRRADERPAILAAAEGREDETVTWGQLRRRVAAAQQGLAGLGVGPGDRVAGFLPNGVATVVLALATISLGGIWSSCSPDFGPMGVVDRFGQIRPKVLAVADGYRYNGRLHELAGKVGGVLSAIDAVAHVVTVDFAGVGIDVGPHPVTTYEQLLAGGATEPAFVALPPDHPVYILYTSGTTGAPKSIVHGAAGTLVKHLAEHRLASDVRPGDVVFWFTTTGWMMWNWLVSALASEATIVLYDGGPAHPDIGALWRLAERAGVTHFGTSPKFVAANERAGARPADLADLSRLRMVLSTGSPLTPEQFDWVYANVRDDVPLASVSGGTDLIGCFAGGAPTLPVRRGELQARSLGMAVQAWDAAGRPVIGEKGELVCTRPFPSMPVGFWDDPDGTRYHEAYFAAHPGVWTHGDFIEIRPEGGVVIYGRSDTTLNPGGVRIGTAEIYRSLAAVPEVADAVVFGRPVDGDVEVVLCVVPASGVTLDEALTDRIRVAIREATSPRHVPAHVFAVPDVPYTFSGKKVEKAVARVVAGERVDNRDALANPDALDGYANLPFPDSARASGA
ncbi:MAG TPA: acetoacetate--CoA ligase [Egibacteraceae bacterium]|nr:acetoacetate--CoA ligase [Egibacteraceae bacterium]